MSVLSFGISYVPFAFNTILSCILALMRFFKYSLNVL
jgi:hypothetical protein